MDILDVRDIDLRRCVLPILELINLFAVVILSEVLVSL